MKIKLGESNFNNNLTSKERIHFFLSILDLRYQIYHSRRQPKVQKALEEKFTGGAGISRRINVLMLMPGLRDLNEYWSKCGVDADGVPIETVENKVKLV